MPQKMWLYTENDGCNGQMVRGTITHDDAARIVMAWYGDDYPTLALAKATLSQSYKDKQEFQIEGEVILLPIINKPVNVDKLVAEHTAEPTDD